jgi:hypothetical protein
MNNLTSFFLASFVFVATLFGSPKAYAQFDFHFLQELNNPGNPGGLLTSADNAPGGPWVKLINGSSDSTGIWSSTQNITFNFTLGDKTFTKFKVSSTGVVTFTDTATAVPSIINEALPSANIPDYSVMAWGFQGGGSNDIVKYTVMGSEPNRQLHIKFDSYGSPGDINSFNFYDIVLEETTNMVYFVDMFRGNISSEYLQPGLTIGAQINSENAIFLDNSTEIEITNLSSDNSDNDYYQLVPGLQAQNDVEFLGFNLSNKLGVNKEVFLGAEFKNKGSGAVTSYRINYSIDGADTLSALISDVNIAPSEETELTSTVGWTPTEIGKTHNVKVWVDSVNRTADEKPENNLGEIDVLINTGGVAIKRVLIEEFSTAPCQFCPDGAVVIENILGSVDNTIVVQHHAGFGTDLMTIPAHEAYAGAFAAGAPTATVDRIAFAGESKVGFSRNLWSSRTIDQSKLETPVKIEMEVYVDSLTRKGRLKTFVTFLDFVDQGDLRLSLMVAEETVIGSGSGFDQVNYYNSQQGHPYYQKGNPIRGYEHKYVARMVLTDTWGDAVFGTSPTIDSVYENVYDFTVSESFNNAQINIEELSFVGFVSYHNDDVNKRDILNANQVGINHVNTAVKNVNSINSKIYPNPSDGITNVELSLDNSEFVTFEVFNIIGSKVNHTVVGNLPAGNIVVPFNMDLNAGIYLLKVTAGKKTSTQKIQVN